MTIDASGRPSRFLPLTVTDVRRETRDAVVVTLRPRDEDRDAFRFVQGQYLTFRRSFDGEEMRRSYSICSGCDEGALRVGIKKVSGGWFSHWANEELRPGETLEAMPPAGRFHVPLDATLARHHLFVAIGSGITPILGLIRTTLSQEPRSRVTLVYGNRTVASIMFREELEDLKNLHLGRVSVVHILKANAGEADLFTGRIDAEKCRQLFRRWIDIGSVDAAFICGPEPMMRTVAQSLRDHGLADDRIKFELFAAGQPAKTRRPVSAASLVENRSEVTITLDGVSQAISVGRDGETVLDAALAARIDAPYACKAGVCSTCRARVTAGEVEMETNHALEDDEVRRGFVLTCQARPMTERVALTYDA
jgi:ring-1,2-phenylacetyl-CoA epoxidase subunit PaaE